MPGMVRAAARVASLVVQGVLLGLAGWSTLTSLAGWRTPPPAPAGARSRRFRVVVPAHDEARVLPGLLADLARQDYDPELVRVCVLADRCGDGTEAVAERAGAEVAARTSGEPGKGPTLAWYLAGDPLDPDEALVVLDADNRVPVELLARFADELDAGHLVLQAYLDVTNPDASLLATASALTYWAGNRTVQLARRNLGWSADLGGTGMCLTGSALEAVGGFGASLTEDQELTARLALAGITVTWLHDVRIRDEKPRDVGVAVRQRGRWVQGKRQVARRHACALLRRAVAARDPGAADLAVRLVQPGRSFVALLSALLAGASAATAWPGLLPWRVWAAAAAVQVGLPAAFLARDGVPAKYVARYPLVTLLALLWVPIRIMSRLRRLGWYHTPHGGSSR
jgi:cellulose synthase/poly-beta-1,6-N-acetylglucosamine synthase-like glycosyltransferase